MIAPGRDDTTGAGDEQVAALRAENETLRLAFSLERRAFDAQAAATSGRDALARILDLCDEAEKAGSHVTRLASIQAIRAAARTATPPPINQP